MKYILFFIVLFLTSCTKDEGGKCYEFFYDHTITSTPNQSGYPIDEKLSEMKCGLDDDVEALEYSKTIGRRSNNKMVNGHLIVEGYTVTLIKRPK
jgi:hypothetical protein